MIPQNLVIGGNDLGIEMGMVSDWGKSLCEDRPVESLGQLGDRPTIFLWLLGLVNTSNDDSSGGGKRKRGRGKEGQRGRGRKGYDVGEEVFWVKVGL